MEKSSEPFSAQFARACQAMDGDDLEAARRLADIVYDNEDLITRLLIAHEYVLTAKEAKGSA